ncbi:YcxB family protein [Streptomyces sp. FIT100]|uniref:YcxB family protein n=1 Tax=Streptomyces sp. FIT100 TaxID=2837956 RepID=UPI0021C91E51|nr:YcxB family protein [Streptomyces sp. FIT100]
MVRDKDIRAPEHSTDTVELVGRPTPADTLVGLRVRERIKRTGLLLRWGFAALWVGFWLASTVGRGSPEPVQTVLALFAALFAWSYPRIQAAHVQRIVGWQGEYRTTVTTGGVTSSSDHITQIQKWSAFRGYRETPGHFVLLSRDPNIMCLDVLPKRGLSTPGDTDRLRAVLDRHTARL